MNQSVGKVLDKASKKYSENIPLRAAIQVIPYVGGALDTLISGTGSKIGQKRVEDFLNRLNERLSQIESAQEAEPSEEFFDLMMAAFDGVIHARFEAKRKHFANLVANQIQQRATWEEAESALRLLSELSDAHIRVILSALNQPTREGNFSRLKVVTVDEMVSGEDASDRPINLKRVLPEYTSIALRLICTELVSRGVFRDEGIGRVGVKAMQYFAPTDTAQWLINWIGEDRQCA